MSPVFTDAYFPRMKRPVDQAKLLVLYLLRSSAAAIATTSTNPAKTAAASATTSTATTSAAAVPIASGVARNMPPSVAEGRILLRLARRTDVPSIQRCNLATLPENYNSQFYCDHLRQWPDLALVAEHIEESQSGGGPSSAVAHDGRRQDGASSSSSSFLLSNFPGLSPSPKTKIVAYVLGKVVDTEPPHPLPPPIATTTRRDDLVGILGRKGSRGMVNDQEEEEEAATARRREELQRRVGGGAYSHHHISHHHHKKNAGGPVGHITSLAVLKEYRRQGLAAALMDQLHLHLHHSYRCRTVGLHVRKSNKAAYGLYERDGYYIEQVIPGYYQDGEDAYLMRKRIPVTLTQQQQQQQQQLLWGKKDNHNQNGDVSRRGGNTGQDVGGGNDDDNRNNGSLWNQARNRFRFRERRLVGGDDGDGIVGSGSSHDEATNRNTCLPRIVLTIPDPHSEMRNKSHHHSNGRHRRQIQQQQQQQCVSGPEDELLQEELEPEQVMTGTM